MPDKGPNCPGSKSPNCIDFEKILNGSFELIFNLFTCFFILLKICSIKGFFSNKTSDLFCPILDDFPPANITPSTSAFNYPPV